MCQWSRINTKGYFTVNTLYLKTCTVNTPFFPFFEIGSFVPQTGLDYIAKDLALLIIFSLLPNFWDYRLVLLNTACLSGAGG